MASFSLLRAVSFAVRGARISSRSLAGARHCCSAICGTHGPLMSATPGLDKLVPRTGDDAPPDKGNYPIHFDASLYPTITGSSMKSLVKKEAAPGLWLEQSEIPQIRDDEVLIKVKKASVCGTDLHIYRWDAWSQRTVPVPMTTGHEYVGVVEEVGRSVKGLQRGQRVTGEGHVTCGYCRNCRAGKRHLCRNTLGVGVNRPGAFAEYVAIPAENAFALPDDITDDFASIMDPLGNAVHSALSFDLVGEDVLITGAGPIGMMACAVCKQVGARHVVITDVNDFRLDLAKQCGADIGINVAKGNSKDLLQQAMRDLGMTEGFDVGLEMSGTGSGLHDMLDTSNHGAKISILGIPAAPFSIELDKVVFKGLHIKGIYGREMFETWYKMSNLLVAGLQERIAPVITHRYNIEDFQKGFDVMESGDAAKVVLDISD